MPDFSLLKPYDVLCAVLVVSLYFVGKRLRTRKDSLPLPPGPRKLPLLGNLLDVPSSFEWETFYRWSKEYRSFALFSKRSLTKPPTDSDVLHLSVIGTSIIVLNSAKSIKDLLEKRSSSYSNRYDEFHKYCQ